MTKAREPVSIQRALTKVAGEIGWAEAAKIVGRVERTVRRWGDPDVSTEITIANALRLDAAYVAAGGTRLPMFETYALLAEEARSEALACRIDLLGDVAELARESGEALAAAALVAKPGSTKHQALRALEEAEQAYSATGRMVIKLKRFVKGPAA